MDVVWLWYVLAVLLVLAGTLGTILPVLPGVPMVFLGLWLAAWAEGFVRVGPAVLLVLALLAAFSVVVDLLASVLGARRAGATRGGLTGAALGTVVGLFFGLPGLILGPLIGAVTGELLYRRGVMAASQVGVATWLALIVAAVVKVAMVFVMLGIFGFAWVV